MGWSVKLVTLTKVSTLAETPLMLRWYSLHSLPKLPTPMDLAYMATLVASLDCRNGSLN